MEIKASFRDHAYIKLEAELSVLKDIHSHFSFHVKGYKYMPEYKAGRWDGKIKLYNHGNRTLPRGLLQDLIDFCHKDGRRYYLTMDDALIEDFRTGGHDFDTDWSDTLTLTSKGEIIKPEPYQSAGLGHAIRNRRSIVQSPTGSGKSLVIYLYCRYLLEKGLAQKILIVVPSTSLVEQMIGDFCDYSSLDPDFFPEDIMHGIYSGRSKDVQDSAIVCSTWQSIYSIPKDWFLQFDGVVVDECHTCKAKSLNTVMGNLALAKYRMGTTGTFDGDNNTIMQIRGLFGDIFRAAMTKDLIRQGKLANLKINVLSFKYPKGIMQKYKMKEHKHEINYIVGHTSRNQFIVNLALDKTTENTLILFNLLGKHGKVLYRMLNEANTDPERKILFVSGAVKVEEREKIRKTVEATTGTIVVASFGTYQQGINIKNLNNIIFAAPSNSQIRVLQSIGRALRVSDKKKSATLYDIVDVLSRGKMKNHVYRHGIERMRLYKKEQHPYKIYDIEMGED